MLTKTDIEIIREMLNEEMDKKFDVKLKPIHKKLNKLDNKIDYISRRLDSDIVGLIKRTTRIENHLQLSVV